MNDAQTWTLIGGFLAILIAMNTLVLATMRAELTTLREHVDGLSAQFEAKISGLRGEIAVRFDAIDRRLDKLDAKVGQIESTLLRSYGERIAKLEARP